jgi:hypothetical protein
VLGGVEFPLILPREIPVGVVSVSVIVQDYATKMEHASTMTAGSVGMTVTQNGSGIEGTSFQPRSGWWMLEESVKPLGS